MHRDARGIELNWTENVGTNWRCTNSSVWCSPLWGALVRYLGVSIWQYRYFQPSSYVSALMLTKPDLTSPFHVRRLRLASSNSSWLLSISVNLFNCQHSKRSLLGIGFLDVNACLSRCGRLTHVLGVRWPPTQAATPSKNRSWHNRTIMG